MIAIIFCALASLIHVYIFVMESLLWGTPKINKDFGVNKEEAEMNRLFAFNQGFYNLFLAIAGFVGIALMQTQSIEAGRALVLCSCLSMFGASLVLISSNRKLLRPAIIQGGPPLIALITMFL